MHKIRSDRQAIPQERQPPIKKAIGQVESGAFQGAPSTSRYDHIIHLQQTVGNQAVLRLLAQNRIEANPSHRKPAARSARSPLPSQSAAPAGIVARQCACETASDWNMRSLQRDDDSSSLSEDTGPSGNVAGDQAAAGGESLFDVGGLGGLLGDATAPCTPASSALTAKAMHLGVRSTWIPFSVGALGAEATTVWDNYLDPKLPLPRPTRNFVGSGEVVGGFAAHHKSAEAEKEVVIAAGKALNGSALLPAPGATKSIPVTSAVPAATLSKRINDKADPMGLNYDSPATTIPGNLAGGIGAGGKPGNTVALDPDTRDVDGTLQLSLDAGGTRLIITPALTFKVHDTVDFCPGNLGNVLARAETVPMSILEATEARFGTVFAADVPFNVSYPGQGTPQTVPVSIPIP
ncbi:MAG: hypothetical protein ACYDBJ_28210 [Aggregatilineales bacterium]